MCAVAAFLIMSDVGNHLQPDAVYNCEKIGTQPCFCPVHLCCRMPPSFSPSGICPKLPPGSASILSANVTETLTGLVKVNVKLNVSKVRRIRYVRSHS